MTFGRLLSDTLGQRIACIVVAGILAGHLLTFVILAPGGVPPGERPERGWTNELALAVRALDATPAHARERVAERLRVAGIEVDLGATPVPEGDAIAPTERGQEVAGLAGVRVSLPVGPSEPRAYAQRTPLLVATLADGTTVSVARAGESMRPPPPPGTRLGAVALVWAGVTLAIALIAVRLAMRPLKTLAREADALGHDLARPAIAVRGPSEVRRAAATLNGLQARVADYLAQRTRMLAAISHDLQTPLARLRMRIEAVADPALRARMERDVVDMHAMIEDTLTLVRASGDREGARVLVDLDALVESLVLDAREAGGRVALTGSAGAPVSAWPIALKRAIANLLDNALRYAGAAEIDLGGDNDKVRVRVRDRGPGLDPDDLARAGEPYFRSDRARGRHTGGHGLGLAIAGNIARAHGGDLVLGARDGGGLVATLAIARRSRTSSRTGEATMDVRSPGW